MMSSVYMMVIVLVCSGIRISCVSSTRQQNVPTNGTLLTTYIHPEDAGFDCEGKVAKGTVPHHLKPLYERRCCHPIDCDGGTITFCTTNNGTDTCVPCPENAKCNYRRISSNTTFMTEPYCTEECIRKGAVPEVVFSPVSHTTQTGDVLTLKPKIYSDSELTGYLWMFINKSSSYTIASSIPVNLNPGKYTVGTVQKPYLTISKIQLSDQGTYQLYVTNDIGMSRVRNVTLEVTSQPIVIMVKKRDNVDAGSTYTIKCSVTGNPKPKPSNMTFTDTSGKVTEISVDVLSGGVVTHTIHNASAGDSGEYTCGAENSEDRSTTTFTLTVHTPPILYSPYAGRIINCDVGESMSMPVWVTTTPSVEYLPCQRSDDQSKKMARSMPYNITSVGMTFNFSLRNIHPYDVGKYVCTATNRLGVSSIAVYIIINSTIYEQDDKVKGKEDCKWLHYSATTISVIAVVVSVAVLIVCKYRENITHGTYLLICCGSIFAVSVVNCVVAVLDMDDCSTLIIVVMSILSIILLGFTVIFLILIRRNLSEKKNEAVSRNDTNGANGPDIELLSQ